MSGKKSSPGPAVRPRVARRKRPTSGRHAGAGPGLELRPSLTVDPLEAARQEFETLLSATAHDLRAPVRAMDGFAKILIEKFSPGMPAEARRLLRHVRGSAGKMGRLVDGLHYAARMGRQAVLSQRVSVSALVAEVLKELRKTSDARRIQVRIGKLPDGVGDPALLKEVFFNLLSNAFKFTRHRQPAVIEVGCRQTAGENAYFVRDKGVGFDLQHGQKLFELFPRLHGAEEFAGAGVGLAVVHRIITRHRGRLWAESRPEYGATFYFSLPNAGVEAPRVRPRVTKQSASPTPKLELRVLMLEDNLQDRDLICSKLEEENIHCAMSFAGGRADFEATLEQGGFHLVLSDYSLPQFDGLAALRLVRKKDPDLPFILISGTLGEEQAVECLRLGATDYVLKERLARLGPVIRRALKEAEVLAAQRRADETTRELSRRLLRLQDEERRRVANELHNSVAQNLMALELHLSSARRMVPAIEGKAQRLLAESAALAEESALALRTVSHLLHPTALDALGLPGALRDFLEGFARRSGIKVTLTVAKKFGRLPAEIEMALYRVAQESLTNIHRHSGSARANIKLQRNKKAVTLEIQDAGRGVPDEALHQPGAPGTIGVGIAGMRERLQLLQGRLELTSSPAGTRVRAVVPIGKTS